MSQLLYLYTNGNYKREEFAYITTKISKKGIGNKVWFLKCYGGFVEPVSSIPLVHIGFSTVL